MPNINWTKLKGQDHEKAVKAKIFTFLGKLAEDDTSVGLHIEKMQNPADPRARTARVDQSLRAVLYQLDVPGEERTYVYAGTWAHDTAIERARTQILHRNPINGVAEFIDATMPSPAAVPAVPAPTPSVERMATSYLGDLEYQLTDLTEELGFDQVTADRIFAATSDDELLEIAGSFENQWQTNAVLAVVPTEVVDAV